MSSTPRPQAPATHLGPQALEALRARMQAQVDDLLERQAGLRAQIATPPSEAMNTFVAGSDGAMAAEAGDEAVALLHHEQAELNLLQDALSRMDSGHYGWCSACGEAIGTARLEAMPEARLCIKCQDAAEHAHRI